MPRLNFLEISRYLAMDFKDIINYFEEKNVAESQIWISSLVRYFDS